MLQVRCPEVEEVSMFCPHSTLISFIFPENNKNVVDLLAERKMNVFAMDKVPRISRAQVSNLALPFKDKIIGVRCA